MQITDVMQISDDVMQISIPNFMSKKYLCDAKKIFVLY